MEARALTACGPKCMISWALAYFLLYALHTVKTPTSASQIWGTAYSNYLSSPSQQRIASWRFVWRQIGLHGVTSGRLYDSTRTSAPAARDDRVPAGLRFLGFHVSC